MSRNRPDRRRSCATTGGALCALAATTALAFAAPQARADATVEPVVCERFQEPAATTTQAEDDAAARIADDERTAARLAAAPGRDPAPGAEAADRIGEGWRYGWTAGRMVDVLFLSRTNALLSGRAFAPDPQRCPGPRPVVVIATGLTAPEVVYWWAAQSLAEAGYVVLTFDFQGQGLSEQNGHTNPDGTGLPRPPQCGDATCARGIDGVAGFLTDLQDAVDFALSTDDSPYPKAADGQPGMAVFPYADVVDATRVGLAGHSAGARSISVLQGIDERIGAVVGWDNLATDLVGDRSSSSSQCVTGGLGVSRQRAEPRVPAFGQAAPNNRACNDPELKKMAFNAWQAAGLPTAQLVLRDVVHGRDWAPTPAAPSSHRWSTEVEALLTIAWFDRFLLDDRSALAVLAAPELTVDHHYDGPITVTRDELLDAGFTSSIDVPGELVCPVVLAECTFVESTW